MANTTVTFQHKVDTQPTTADENLSRACAEDALFNGRLEVRQQGFNVEALTKPQQLVQQKRARLTNEGPSSGGGMGEQHPELPEADGLPPNEIVLPESELDPKSTAGQKHQEKLKNKLAAGMGVSAQTAKEEYKKQHKKKLEQTFKHKNRVDAPTNAPRLTRN